MMKSTKPSRPYPHLYEINTRIWLIELSQKYRKTINLSTIPKEEWIYLKQLGFDLIWLMGLWQFSSKSIEIASQHEGLQKEYDKALPGWSVEDVIGSPYSIAGYNVNPKLGTDEDLGKLRKQLHELDLKLILDFVPNHVAVDHPWIWSRPEYFITADKEYAESHQGLLFEVTNQAQKYFIAYGRDPYFFTEHGPWTDTAQLNYFNPQTRQAMIEVVHHIAQFCDGVRCDMTMLVINKNFKNAWPDFAGQWEDLEIAEEFWKSAISSVRNKYPYFIFIAEDYWGKESEKYHQSLGFDYTYNETLYRALYESDISGLKSHIKPSSQEEESYQKHTANFVENHDKERVAAHFGLEKSKASAVIASTLMGLRLFHQGQLEGKKIRIPVQLSHTSEEPLDTNCLEFYEKLLHSINEPCFHEGDWHWLEFQKSGENNGNHDNFLCWYWKYQNAIKLIVVNYANTRSQGRIILPFVNNFNEEIILRDELNHQTYVRTKSEVSSVGLYVDLEPFQFHFFDVEAKQVCS